MSTPKDKDRPEAARDTASGKQGEGAHERDAGSGGTRSKAGSDYGGDDDDRDTAAQAKRNKSFDTTHVHAGTTPRRI